MLNLGGSLLPLFVAAIAIPPTIHLLGLPRFGVLSLAWVVMGYAAVLDLGVGRAATRNIAAHIARQEDALVPKVACTALAANLTLGVIGGVLFAIATPMLVSILSVPSGLVRETHEAFHVVAIAIPVSLLLAAARSVLEGAQRFDLVSLVTSPTAALGYLAPALGAANGLSLPGILSLLLLTRFIAFLTCFWFWGFAFPSGRRFVTPDSHVVRALIGYGGWLTVSSASGPVVTYGERSIVSSVLSVGALGLYSVPYEVVSRLSVIPSALASASYAYFSAGTAMAGRSIAPSFARAVIYLVLTVAPPVLLFVSFGYEILEIWLGVEIATASARPFQIFAIGALLNALGHVPLSFLQATGRAALPAKLHLAEIGPTFVLTWLLATAYGLTGAALAWVLRVGIETAILHLMIRREPRLGDVWQRRDEVRMALVVAAVVLASAISMIPAVPVRLAIASLLFMGFFITTWSTITVDDRNLIVARLAAVGRTRVALPPDAHLDRD
jgi:O-antigen/teichoic acid export membrane protein